MTELTNTINNPIEKKGFSWQRVKMIFDFYLPTTKYQMMAYPIISFVLAFFLLLTISAQSVFLIFIFLGMFGMVYALYWNPIIFSRRNYHLIETILPVTGNEKVAFYFIYSFLLIPLITLVGAAAGFGVSYIFPGVRELINNIMSVEIPAEFKSLPNGTTISYIISVILSAFNMILSSLFGVMYFKKNKALMAIVISVGASIVLGIIGSITSFIFRIEDSGFNGALSFTLYFSLVLSAIYGAILLYYTIRTIKYRQV